jgi:rhomboid protease GluP
MAFGFLPRFRESMPLDNLSNEQFLALAAETAIDLGWNLGQCQPVGLSAYSRYSIRSQGEEIQIQIENGIAELQSECIGSQIIDLGKNRANIQKFTAAFIGKKEQVSTESLVEKTEWWKNLLSSDGNLPEESRPSRNVFSTIFSLFKPVRNYFVTPLIVDLNILVFVLMVITGVNAWNPDNQSLLQWGANFRPATLNGEWWRLLTCCFLHVGILHLAFNMYALIYIGLLLEPRLGTERFICAYILTGLSSSISSSLWHPFTVSAGASGAIFGMYGVFLALLTTSLIENSARKALLTSIGIFVAFNLLNGTNPVVDNAAHVGGLVSGLIIGYGFYPSLFRSGIKSLKYRTIGILSSCILLSCFLLYRNMPNDIGVYQIKMRRFELLENMALEIYRMPRNTSQDRLLTEIKDRGLYFWNENIQLLDEADKLNLPSKFHERNKILLEYCNLRIKSYELMYKAIEENSDKYNDQLEQYNNQIKAIIQELSGT